MAGRKVASGVKEETLGARIRRYRLAKDLTQERFGALVGIAQRTVTYYELKGISPPPKVLVKMADVLGVTTDVLLGRVVVPPTSGDGRSRPVDKRRLKHLETIDALPLNDRKAVFRIIEALYASAKRRGA